MTALPRRRHKSISYAKWGYIFLIPFFAAFCVFTLAPLFSTAYLSFFESYMSGLKQIGPTYVGLANYVKLITQSDLPKYLFNTLWLWFLGFVPQIGIALLLAVWFTDLNLKLKAQSFFKTVIYMPNLIMASAFAMLIFALFSDSGPINNILQSFGIEPCRFLATVNGTRGLIAMINFLMWFGNTTIVLMAAIMGIDTCLFEAAEIDGAGAWQTFSRITVPLIKPLIAYVLVSSLIGGLQMFDVPQVLTNGKGSPDRTSMTLIMFLNNHLTSKNYGMAGALSVLMFIVTGALSIVIYRSLTADVREQKRLLKGGALK